MNFIRRDSNRYSRIGKGRRKLQKWRRPKGRDNKMRLRRVHYPATVSVGYRSPKEERGKINGLYPVLVNNLSDVEKLTKKSVAILSSRLGARKKVEVMKKISEMKVPILNASGDKK